MNSTSSSSTPAPTDYLYDVFLSFDGKDTRYSFVDHLYAALHRAGISTFRYDEEIERGQEPMKEIGRSITQSRASIIVFSKNFAKSIWCLHELFLILEQRRKGSHFVLVVYYCLNALDFHKLQVSIKALGWMATAALTEFANLPGLIVSGYEASFLSKIVDIICTKLRFNMEGRSIGKLFVSTKEIAKGSNGTVVYEGIYDGRKVAVKCLVKAHHDAVSREIQNLIAADQHPNIVRWYDTASDRDFFYLSLERCDCTLYDLIQNNMYSDSFQLMNPNGYPSSILLVLMRDICAGLVHLHDLGIIHRDLKPHNVLIVRREHLCVKLADMGISKPLYGDASSLGPHATASGTSGWRAPEQILDGRRHTRAMDVFSLGCVLFFCMSSGSHPFGDTPYERDGNVINDNKVNLSLVEHIPEARDLCSRMLNPTPEFRPKAPEIPLHPLFWSFETRMSFVRDTSDWVESERRKGGSVVGTTVLRALNNKGRVVFRKRWDGVLDPALLSEMGQHKTYRYRMVRDLLRFVRNTASHYNDLPTNIQALFGHRREGIDDYFRSKFPKLLMEVYNVMYQHCKHEGWFCRYLET